jgi:aminoglycoside phosphotransferase (APT) family kinase protein
MHHKSQFIGNDQLEIMRVISMQYPNALAVRHIEHGCENHIVIIDDKYVVRFPRSEEIWQRVKLEQFVLSRLESPLVPKVVEFNNSPPYLVQTFLPGKHVSENEFRKLPLAVQRSIGGQIAEFAFRLHSSIGVNEFSNEYDRLTPQGNSDGSYGDYLKEMLFDFTFPTIAQDELAKRYFSAWRSILPSKSVVVHDDLHIHNLLFQKDKLSGVVDFGAICVGTAEQEMRQVYRLSEAALTEAIETYNDLAHTKLDPETSRIWATTQELAIYAREFIARRTDHSAFKHAA